MFGARFVRQMRAGAWSRGWQRASRNGGASSGSGGGGSGVGSSGASPLHHHQQRGVHAAAGAVGQLFTQLVQRAGLKLAGGAMVLGGGAGAVTFMTREEQAELEESSETAKLPWVAALAASPGMREVLVPGQQLRRHPVGQLVSEQDHLFETMLRSDQIREFRCFFDPSKREFHSVVVLGKDVCGYPSTVHGGLTAAIVDETFGGLYVALLTSGGLGLRLPGVTARLEVDYKRPVAAPTVLQVSAEVESVEARKVWMRATVSDGKGGVYASARALFVAPNIGKAVAKAVGGGGGRGAGGGGAAAANAAAAGTGAA